MRKAALVSIFAGLVYLSTCDPGCRGQDAAGYGGVESAGFSTSYSPTSSHILIGDAQQRRVFTLGIEATRLLHQGRRFRLDYEASAMPLWEETDPSVTGIYYNQDGNIFYTPQAPTRVVYVNNAPVGTAVTGLGTVVPVYPIYSQEDTYAAAFTPLGARITAMPRWPIRPSFSLDLGFVVSSRDIPVNQSAQFNYLFSFGPGLEFFTDHNTSFRVDYLFRHMSNAGQGTNNPGLDQAVFRLTLSLHRNKR